MISPEQHRRLKDLVEAALERPAGERDDFLAVECSTEPDLKREAEELIALYSDEDPTAEPEHIGPYRLIKEIGSGGMGVVYLSEREGDYHRKVAIKVLRGMDTDFFLARFFKEREILGAMDHPGVVRIVDAGSTVEGRPYLVMDFVDGIRIDKYCEQKQIPVNDRLKIFIKVCSAVQHAHRNLIVHRDLKPGNILVTPEGEPKLLDFGIAKVVDENDERTQLTIPIMTRQYASPEQVRGKRITTSCDIYALGLILYEMLTGERPYDLKDKPVDEVERLVCIFDPPPPSATVTENTTRYTLRGDLDRIVMMALRKEPERRYGSVEAMATDLTRYLDGRPVSAQRDTWHYRAGKYINRNRGSLVGAAVIAATIIGGTAGILWQARIAQTERARADARFAEVRSLANSMLFDLHAAIRELPGSAEAQRLLLANAIKYSERLALETGNDPKLQAELAIAYERIGLLQGGSLEASSSLGDTAGALVNQQKALAIREKLVTSYPADAGYQGDLASSYLRMGELQPDVRLGYARKAISIYNALGLKRTSEMASAYRLESSALLANADPNAALAATEKELEIRQRLATGLAGEIELAEAQERHATILEKLGRSGEALPLVKADTAVFEKAVATTPHNVHYQRLLADHRRHLADLLSAPRSRR
jgi:non-specific serine/threonine protein kinase/serine/threonine-protein kinase